MEQEAIKKKKKRVKTRTDPEEVSDAEPPQETTPEQDSTIECALRDASLDVEDCLTDVSVNCRPVNTLNEYFAMNEMSIERLSNNQLLEVNGNGRVQETALTEVVVTAPTAPAIEESFAIGNVVRSEEITPAIDEGTFSVLSDVEERTHYDSYIALSESSLLALYDNQELLSWKEYLSAFSEMICLTSDNLLLNDKMDELFRLRGLIESDLTMLEQHKSAVLLQVENVWTFEKHKITENGECQDGNPVTAELTYFTSRFNDQVLAEMCDTLNSVKEICYETLVLNLHLAEQMKEHIEKQVDRICNPCLINTTVNMPALLLQSEEQIPLKDNVVELRTCFGILFKILRRKQRHGPFSQFVTGLLVKVVSVMLRVATWRDHLFLLHHVLGTPGKIPAWMINFIQIPLPQDNSLPSPFQSRYLDHLVTVLSVLMSPIEHRHNYYEYADKPKASRSSAGGNAIKQDVEERSWTMVDSDGEEEETCISGEIDANDITELFNQLPLEQMYIFILQMEKNEIDKYVINIKNYHNRYMLELFAFCTVLIRLYQQGLHTYGTYMYQQFAKRLGQLIKHTVQYVTDAYERYSTSLNCNCSLQQLQAEYDNFIIRAVNAIYSSTNLGMWQFLATLPFHLLSTSASWKVYYILHNEYDSNTEKAMPGNVDEWNKIITEAPVCEAFEDRLCTFPESEAIYLLSAFSSLALPSQETRDEYKKFIITVTLDLFQIGFLSDMTQDMFTKHIRTLLAAITVNHPWLISHILHKMSEYNFIKSERLCLELFKDLSLTLWTPSENDLAIIRPWLCDKPLLSVEFSLARLILSGLNYDVNQSVSGDDLMLSHSLQCKIALMVAEATMGFTENQGNSISCNTGVIRDMITKFVGSGSGLEIAYKWAWELLLRMRLHSLDRGRTIPRDTIREPEIYLQNVPDLHGHPELEVISKGVLARHPIACFVAILMTSCGHSVPLICTKGFPLIIDVLLPNQKYRVALACLYHLVPMFLNCPESLIACDSFHSILVAVCSGDKSFLRMARNLLSSDFPGPVLRHTGAMIESHLKSAANSTYGACTIEKMITMWLRCLAKVPDWVNDNSVLYLMDIILRKAFFLWNSYHSANYVLNEQSLVTNAEATTVPMYLDWMLSLMVPPYKSLMSRVSLPSTPWFAAFVLLAEKDWQQDQTLWPEVQIKLYNTQAGTMSLDSAVKYAIRKLALPVTIPASNLAIFRWAQQALDTPIGHPIAPYQYHVFFTLYLARVPADPPHSAGSVGDRFFEGAVGQQMIKKIKKHLLASASYYNAAEGRLRSSASDNDQDTMVAIAKLAENCRLFKTYHLWLEDSRLMGNVVLANLEPMYDIPRLRAVFNGHHVYGRKFLDESDVQVFQQQNLVSWERAMHRNRDHHRKPSMKYNRRIEPVEERIWKRLASYQTPIVPNPMPRFTFQSTESNNGDFLQHLIPRVNEQLQVLRIRGQVYSNSLAEHAALALTLQELAPLVYSNVQMEKVLTAVCHSSPPHRGSSYPSRESTCAGQAEMRAIVTESRVNETFKENLDDCRKEWLHAIEQAVRAPKHETCTALICLENVIESLIEYTNNKNLENQRNSSNAHHMDMRCIIIEESGVALFFHILGSYSEEVAFFPPARATVQKCLTRLASVFLKDGHYVEQLLHALLDDLRLADVLSTYVRPVVASTSKFIHMYRIMVNKAYEELDLENFIKILQQFDVRSWLSIHRPTLADSSALIEEIAKAILAAGLQPEERKEELHDFFRNDLMAMLQYKYPENFGNVLNHLLKGSALQRVSLSVWYDFINIVASNRMYLGMEGLQLRDEIRHCATNSDHTPLPYQEVLQTSELLSTYFLSQRNIFGLYGLYPKYRTYVEPIMTFQALIGHLLTVAVVSEQQVELSVMVCNRLWKPLEAMYSPWIAPLWTEQMEEPVAPWIDQLTNDRSVMLPWIPPDKLHAIRAMLMFVEGVRFILDSVSGDILSHVWKFYATKFASKSVPVHILLVVHPLLETLPWHQFCPTTCDLELMHKLLNQCVPAEVYNFLGTIFINVAWVPWLNKTMVTFSHDYSMQQKIQVCMVHLYVKLSREKEVRKKSKITEMLTVAKKFEWHLLDANAYGHIIDYWVFWYDPKVAAGLSEPYINPIDKCVMNLLEAAAGFTPEVQCLHATTLQKRICYVRGLVTMLIKCSRERYFIEQNSNNVSGVINSLLSSIENITQQTVLENHRLSESTRLVKEVIPILIQPESNELTKLALKVCCLWLQHENGMSCVVQGFLGVVGTDIRNPAILGELLETCITSYFKNTVMLKSTSCWRTVAHLLSDPALPKLEDTLLSSGYFLSLHALLYKRMAAIKNAHEEVTLMTNVVDWICQVKPSGLVESKLPLLWGFALMVIHRQCEFDVGVVTRNIRRLISHFSDMSEEKGQFWNILGTLGLKKNQILSLKGRLLCRAMAAFLLAQLPDGSNEQITLRVNSSSPGAIVGSQKSASGESVAQPIPSVDAVKALRDLEALVGHRSYLELKDTLDLAIKLIKDPDQTVKTAKHVLGILTAQLYTEQYLLILTA